MNKCSALSIQMLSCIAVKKKEVWPHYDIVNSLVGAPRPAASFSCVQQTKVRYSPDLRLSSLFWHQLCFRPGIMLFLMDQTNWIIGLSFTILLGLLVVFTLYINEIQCRSVCLCVPLWRLNFLSYFQFFFHLIEQALGSVLGQTEF